MSKFTFHMYMYLKTACMASHYGKSGRSHRLWSSPSLPMGSTPFTIDSLDVPWPQIHLFWGLLLQVPKRSGFGVRGFGVRVHPNP